jgi:hypothetical protein
MNIKKVSCFLHGKEFIGIDTHVFKICCKKCVELNLENREANLVSNVKDNVQHETNDEANEESGNIVECSKHEGTRGIFFCDDCNEFLCKACFANDHRTHNSNMPKVISINLKDMLSQLIFSLKELNIDETLKNMQELNNRLKSQRKESSVKNSSLQNKIQLSLKEKSCLIVNTYYDLFGGLDKESDGVTQRLDAVIKKIHKSINSLTEYIKKVETSQSDQSICMQHKEMKNTLIIIRKFIEDSNHFLKVKILETKDRIQENTAIMFNNLEKFTKNQQIFENSVTSSIISGITSQSIRIRRYVKFDMMCKYYKTSSLIVKSSRAISLVGLGICGLYPMKVIKKVSEL